MLVSMLASTIAPDLVVGTYCMMSNPAVYFVAVHMIKAILFTKTKNPMSLLYYVAYHYLSHDFPVANHKHAQLSVSTTALFIQW